MRTRLLPSLLAVTMGICVTVTNANSHDFLPSMPMRNTNIPPSTAKKFDDPVVSGGLNAVVNAYKIWGAGETLNVCFMGGTADVKRFFIDTEREWEKFASIKWDFGSAPDYRACDPEHPSHIRVAFEHVGHWSRVGTDAINKEVIGSASLNIDLIAFGDFSLANKKEVRGVMLHEQGHALGLEHEHQNPSDPCISHIKWTTVYAEMGQPPNKWDKEMVDENLKALVKTERLRTTAYDRTSIMHYAFPTRWFDDPSCAVGQNETLSKLDQQEIKLAYPAEPNDQGKFFAAVSAPAKSAVDSLGLSTGDKNNLQRDINTNRDNLDERLLSVTRVVSVGKDNTGVFVGGNNTLSTTGNCSAAIVGVQGAVNITCGK